MIMHRDTLYLGSTPSDENCAQVGDPRYAGAARLECQTYIAALIAAFGPPPAHDNPERQLAALRIKSNTHDFGPYLEVVIDYDSRDEAACDYAFQVEAGLSTWDETGFSGPVVYDNHHIAGIAFPTAEKAIQFAASKLQARTDSGDATASQQLANLKATYPDCFPDSALAA